MLVAESYSELSQKQDRLAQTLIEIKRKLHNCNIEFQSLRIKKQAMMDTMAKQQADLMEAKDKTATTKI